ncbi:retron Ec67 family RNA-directed DNA polymerase/endonuclease [Labrenzia sp. R4_2]|uniref:retron Ec67 family RNA-directed DNA polymerase/endonuclease n=1 Tax=Labrenzia sp. R4_2 TaxID=2821107 RepID=UPI001AD9955E|nr:retron Ec67 family RNA-directed DNA polymerase/endonuclease [Labrenzia sp. R4_2]MBO9419163.1 retron Ec67 family RNA-directed DNA polymerase/endonuclease [Labrenzia sp. R4_2]
MSRLQSLQQAENLDDLAKLLGFSPTGLSYVLYRIPEDKKYRVFDVPKKGGGVRIIKAPNDRLGLLQLRLAELLSDCGEEIRKKKQNHWHSSHGFRKGRNIISNADAHRRRRFVFNLDLEDFFGTINFGRVRGLFIADKAMALRPNIATLIAKIACHDNALPQGSPCSPVISNFVGNILDSRMLALARDGRCTYTRYADDLTFSTNEKIFPKEIAVNLFGADWGIGERLRKEVEGAGFQINHGKTRMFLRQSRQTVTGLVVNAKTNINQDYYRTVRAMCHSVFKSGTYHRETPAGAKTTTNLAPLEGMLSHIYFVKARRDRTYKNNSAARDAGEFRPPEAPVRLYDKFLFYRRFVALPAPLIVPEGKTDNVYVHSAIRNLVSSFPRLGTMSGTKFECLVDFLKPTPITKDVMNIGHGASGQNALISKYAKQVKRYPHKPLDHPVIILCDNDDGPRAVFSSAGRLAGKTITKQTTDPFYYLGDNLYLVKVPEGTPATDRDMEDLFDPVLLAQKVGGKPFDKKKEHGDGTAYGKEIFANQIVRPNWQTVNFENFRELLERIDQCITDYSSRKPAGSP